MRNYFDEQLELLNVELIRMGSLCEDAIMGASRTLMGEEGFAKQVNDAEQEFLWTIITVRLMMQNVPPEFSCALSRCVRKEILKICALSFC